MPNKKRKHCFFTRKKRKKHAGFSLIETLISAGLLVFVIVGLCQTLCLGLILKQKADWQRISADVISSKIEKLKSLSPEDEELRPGKYSELISDLATGRKLLLEWEIKDEENDLKKIHITVNHPESTTIRPIKATFYYSNRLGF